MYAWCSCNIIWHYLALFDELINYDSINDRLLMVNGSWLKTQVYGTTWHLLRFFHGYSIERISVKAPGIILIDFASSNFRL